MCKCLYCYQPLAAGEQDFHASCARRFFGLTTPPVLEYTRDNLDELASQIIAQQTTLTGVQPKLSLYMQQAEGLQRLTIVGLWGEYILKPQSDTYPELPEVEDLTMHLAQVCKIDIVPHTLIRMADGSLCYLTRRIDRTKDGKKIAMEDLCQLTNRLTEHKYKCSYEVVGETIQRYSSVPKMDAVNFLDVLLFCYLTGNNDMHLKNFSLYQPRKGEVRLTPAYDLINAAIVYPNEDELALKLNNKRRDIGRDDFYALAQTLHIEPKTVDNLIQKYRKCLPQVQQLIESSFVSEVLQTRYLQLYQTRLQMLSINM